MAGAGRSGKGRGGSAPKKATAASSSSRPALETSNPSVTRSRLPNVSTPLPSPQQNSSDTNPSSLYRTPPSNQPPYRPPPPEMTPQQIQQLNLQQQSQNNPPGERVNTEQHAAPEAGASEQTAHMSLDELLSMEGRELFLPTLSPVEGEGMWFTRDEQVIVKKISKILKDKFDGPYYNWSATPTEIQDRYFTQLAHRFTWHPWHTAAVREGFEEVAGRRLKGLVSYCRRTRHKPRWIGETLWGEMVSYWETDDAKERSKNASQSRNSTRDGLGPHKHVGGPKSNAQVQREMEKALGREVSHGEVFIKTHTRKDGTYVDGKAEKVGEVYKKNLDAKLDEIDPDHSFTSDAASRISQLSTEQMNAIFRESTFTDDRGNVYGLGSLSREHAKRQKLGPVATSSTIIALESQLKEAKEKIEEQATLNAVREAETRECKSKVELMMSYFKKNNPDLVEFMEAQVSSNSVQQEHGP